MMMNSYNMVDTKGSEYFFLQQLIRENQRINAQSSWQRQDLAAMQTAIAMSRLLQHPAYHFNASRYNPLQGPIIKKVSERIQHGVMSQGPITEKLSERIQHDVMPQDEKNSTSGLKLLQAANVSLPKMAAVTEPVVSLPKLMTATAEPVKYSSSERKEGGRVYIDRVGDLDILCGRGGRSNHHVGNKRFRQVVDEMKRMYRSTEVKAMKTDLSQAIVDHVYLYGGRFVKKDGKSGRYYNLTRVEARKKTSQALRENKEVKWKP